MYVNMSLQQYITYINKNEINTHNIVTLHNKYNVICITNVQMLITTIYYILLILLTDILLLLLLIFDNWPILAVTRSWGTSTKVYFWDLKLNIYRSDTIQTNKQTTKKNGFMPNRPLCWFRSLLIIDGKFRVQVPIQTISLQSGSHGSHSKQTSLQESIDNLHSNFGFVCPRITQLRGTR